MEILEYQVLSKIQVYAFKLYIFQLLCISIVSLELKPNSEQLPPFYPFSLSNFFFLIHRLFPQLDIAANTLNFNSKSQTQMENINT